MEGPKYARFQKEESHNREREKGILYILTGKNIKPDPYEAKMIIDTYIKKIIPHPDSRVEVVMKIKLPLNGSGGISYNVGAEGGSRTHTGVEPGGF